MPPNSSPRGDDSCPALALGMKYVCFSINGAVVSALTKQTNMKMEVFFKLIQVIKILMNCISNICIKIK